MTIYEELNTAAATVGFKPQKPGESDQDHLKALATAINKIDDATWQALSKQAAEWFNAAGQAINGMKPIPECPGFTSVTVQSVKQETKNEAKKKAISTPPVKITPPPQPPKVKRVRQTGVVDAIRKVFILHPDWTARQAHDYLIANGFPDISMDTVAVNAGDIRHVIILAREMGFWNDEKYKEQEEPLSQQEPAPAVLSGGNSGENKTE